jgi:hypothetical protein
VANSDTRDQKFCYLTLVTYLLQSTTDISMSLCKKTSLIHTYITSFRPCCVLTSNVSLTDCQIVNVTCTQENSISWVGSRNQYLGIRRGKDCSHLHSIKNSSGALRAFYPVSPFRPPPWPRDQSSWLQIQRSVFDSRRYQIFWEVVGLEQGPLSPVSTTQELHERKSSSSSLETEHTAVEICCADHVTSSICKSWH